MNTSETYNTLNALGDAWLRAARTSQSTNKYHELLDALKNAKKGRAHELLTAIHGVTRTRGMYRIAIGKPFEPLEDWEQALNRKGGRELAADPLAALAMLEPGIIQALEYMTSPPARGVWDGRMGLSIAECQEALDLLEERS